jgi:protein phosphatase
MWLFDWWKRPLVATTWVESHFGPPKRYPNEDNTAVAEDRDHERCLLVVADGMGGGLNGGQASRLICDEVLKSWNESSATLSPKRPQDSERWIRQAITGADEALVKKVAELGISKGKMASTIVVAAQVGAGVHIGWVGDSRAYHLGDGRFKQVSEDHNFAAELIKAGWTKEQALAGKWDKVLSRYVGGKCKVDYRYRDLKSGDIVFLCSDGVIEVLADERISEILSRVASCAAIGQALMAAVTAATPRDNVTFAFAKFA